MKRVAFLIALTLSLSVSYGQVTDAVKAQEVISIANSHDFGTIRHGRPVTYTFEFTNTGKEAFKIENVSASCGCTTPEWSKELVAPGASSSITVGYNAASEGKFEKSVTIFYNSGKTKTIYIKGEVGKPMPSVPVNTSVQLLKQTNNKD